MIGAAELTIQRQLTASFIAADRISVVLQRSTRTDDGAGGTVTNPPAPLPPQTMRLIPLGDMAQERFTANGQSVMPAYALLGLHTADLERWDEFEMAGRRYQVVFVSENTQYEKKGEVAYRGE